MARVRSRRCAFTFIELVIVLLVMGILTAVAAPKFFDSLLFHRVESAARRVKADLELARTQARLTSASSIGHVLKFHVHAFQHEEPGQS